MPITKKFTKGELQDLLYEDSESLEVIKDRVVDNSRWSIHHDLIFLDNTTGKFYKTGYSRGATESQPEMPFEYDDNEIECIEVEPTEVTVIRYIPVTDK